MIPLLPGNPNSPVKVSEMNAVITAINALEQRVIVLENGTAGVWETVGALPDTEKKLLWKTLRDGE